jgi:hypothetical protein
MWSRSFRIVVQCRAFFWYSDLLKNEYQATTIASYTITFPEILCVPVLLKLSFLTVGGSIQYMSAQSNDSTGSSGSDRSPKMC